MSVVPRRRRNCTVYTVHEEEGFLDREAVFFCAHHPSPSTHIHLWPIRAGEEGEEGQAALWKKWTAETARKREDDTEQEMATSDERSSGGGGRKVPFRLRAKRWRRRRGRPFFSAGRPRLRRKKDRFLPPLWSWSLQRVGGLWL